MVTKNQFIDKWKEYLRSGKYPQTSSCLGDYIDCNNINIFKYCCLGVACVVGQDLGIKGSKFGEHQKNTSAEPGEWFISLFGSGNPRVNVSSKGLTTSLTNCNDVLRLSFVEIADLLDQLKDPS